MKNRKSFWLIWLTYPLSRIYGMVVYFRNAYFDKVWKKGKYRAPLETIVIGNLSTGGTGKSPLVMAFLQNEKPEEVAVLSRGYGRKSKGFLYVETNGDSERFGDEPLMIKHNFPDFVVVVCEDRMKAIKRLKINHPNLRRVILDDAFQHRWVCPDKVYLLSTYSNPFFEDDLLPYGNLRESRHGAKRADVIVFTKCPAQLSNADKKPFMQKTKRYSNAEVRFCGLQYSPWKRVWGNAENPNSVLLVTGIANASPLLSHLEENGVDFIHLEFPDHHKFTPNDVDKIKKNPVVLTTEKDWIRLAKFDWGDCTVFVQPINLKWF
ncbi:MAG: tetraacyldisaccharide 4'-kinase [Cryomorphaceae bacterium]|nr:tetraacyldisaccharide 4'-kinase [Cryomorphaceae bacterium]